jgi:hypothetical protein
MFDLSIINEIEVCFNIYLGQISSMRITWRMRHIYSPQLPYWHAQYQGHVGHTQYWIMKGKNDEPNCSKLKLRYGISFYKEIQVSNFIGQAIRCSFNLMFDISICSGIEVCIIT